MLHNHFYEILKTLAGTYRKYYVFFQGQIKQIGELHLFEFAK